VMNNLTHYRTVMQGSTAQHIRLTGFYRPKSFFNVKDVQDNLNRIGGPTAYSPPTLPSDLAYYVLGGVITDGAQTAGVGNIMVTVRISYWVQFSEPITTQAPTL